MEIKTKVIVEQIGDICTVDGEALGVGAMLCFLTPDCDNESVFVPLSVDDARKLGGILLKTMIATITLTEET